MNEPQPLRRTLEQALVEYLLPTKGPQDGTLKSYGADEIQRMIVSRLPEHLQQQLVRLCDANPVCARDLIQFTIDVSDEAFETERDDAMDNEIPAAEERIRKDERDKLAKFIRSECEKVTQRLGRSA